MGALIKFNSGRVLRLKKSKEEIMEYLREFRKAKFLLVECQDPVCQIETEKLINISQIETVE